MVRTAKFVERRAAVDARGRGRVQYSGRVRCQKRCLGKAVATAGQTVWTWGSAYTSRTVCGAVSIGDEYSEYAASVTRFG